LTFSREVFCANEEDNPFVFLRFEHHELSKETFLKEQKSVELLKRLRETLASRRKSIKKFVDKVKGKNDRDRVSNSCDTITAFNVIKRSSVNVPFLRSQFKEDLAAIPAIRLSVNQSIEDFPDNEDYNGALKGLVMLQDTYDLDLDAATEGNVAYYSSQFLYKEFQGKEKLQVEDLYDLANKATSQLLFDTGIVFLQAAFNLAEKIKPTKSLMKKMKTLRKNLVHLNNKHLMKWQKMLGDNYKCLPYLVDNELNYKPTPDELLQRIRHIQIKNGFGHDFCFKKVCKSGALTRQPETENLPKCGYLHHFNPYLRLGPFKVEVAVRSPYISILHDLLTEEEIEWLIQYSIPRLSRVRENSKETIQPKYEQNDMKKRRTVHKTVQCWITDIDYDEYNEFNDRFNYTINFPLMFKLSKKLELATQMNSTGKYSSTDFQTTNYGLGGLCEKHVDPHGYIEGADVSGPHKGLIQTGDILGTVMAWLGEVEGGGATSFFHNKVEEAIMPSRGSAAFWYNLDRKGFRDTRTVHGGCPIIKGSKWILNKWINYFNQFQNFQCGLTPDEIFPPPKGYYRNIVQ
jgi:prolyl 4-hydroxylase